MNVAVVNGAKPGGRFADFVDWLVREQHVTPPMRDWVDEIHQLGNEANHEIRLMSKKAAEELLTFVEMLLRVVYERREGHSRTLAARSSTAGRPSRLSAHPAR